MFETALDLGDDADRYRDYPGAFRVLPPESARCTAPCGSDQASGFLRSLFSAFL